MLDEADPAHVGGQVVDLVDPRASVLAGVGEGEIGDDALGALVALLPFVERQAVDARTA